MKFALNIEALKFAGSTAIVGAAALIMFPDIIKTVLGFGQRLIIPIIVGSACLLLAVATRQVARIKIAQKGLAAVQLDKPDLARQGEQPHYTLINSGEDSQPHNNQNRTSGDDQQHDH